MAKSKSPEESPLIKTTESPIPDMPTDPNDFASGEVMENEEEPTEPPRPSSEQETFKFDLFYTRFSLITDGIITGLATFITQGWQMYLVALALPLAAGTGSAAKGTILQMCTKDERVDALKAITLLEMIARLATSKYSLAPQVEQQFADNTFAASVFGLIFAAFSNIGMPNLVFTVNAVRFCFCDLLRFDRLTWNRAWQSLGSCFCYGRGFRLMEADGSRTTISTRGLDNLLLQISDHAVGWLLYSNENLALKYRR